MRCSHCGKCCEETEMELSAKDIERLEKCGYNREEFTVNGLDGVIRLRNVEGCCYFYDEARKRCRVYVDKPLGCYLYPVVYSVNEGVMVDDLCPICETISEKELRKKGKILTKLLKAVDREREMVS